MPVLVRWPSWLWRKVKVNLNTVSLWGNPRGVCIYYELSIDFKANIGQFESHSHHSLFCNCYVVGVRFEFFWIIEVFGWL